MKKHPKPVKSILKKLSAPVILILGLVLGFVVDRMANLLAPDSHPAATLSPEKTAPALAVCPPAPEHRAAPAPKPAKTALRGRARKHPVAAAKKHKGKKALRVASAK